MTFIQNRAELIAFFSSSSISKYIWRIPSLAPSKPLDPQNQQGQAGLVQRKDHLLLKNQDKTKQDQVCSLKKSSNYSLLFLLTTLWSWTLEAVFWLTWRPEWALNLAPFVASGT